MPRGYILAPTEMNISSRFDFCMKWFIPIIQDNENSHFYYIIALEFTAMHLTLCIASFFGNWHI